MLFWGRIVHARIVGFSREDAAAELERSARSSARTAQAEACAAPLVAFSEWASSVVRGSECAGEDAAHQFQTNRMPEGLDRTRELAPINRPVSGTR